MTDPLLLLCQSYQREIRSLALRERRLRAGRPAWRRQALMVLGGWRRAGAESGAQPAAASRP